MSTEGIDPLDAGVEISDPPSDFLASLHAVQDKLAKLEERDVNREDELTALREDLSDLKAMSRAIADALKIRLPPDASAPSAPSARPRHSSGQEEVTAADSDNTSNR